jgi:fatty acid desaturase
MTSTTIGGAWAQGRAARKPRTSAPLLLRAVAWAGRTVPPWRRVRTAVMQLTAFGFLDYAAWQWSMIAGCVAVGVSLLVLEALGGDGGGRR